jgi:1-deoxy-D-xylulose 5-phosphate reductoisomerase
MKTISILGSTGSIGTQSLDIIREIEQEKGKSWVDLIYKRNGLRKEEKNV